METYFLVDAIAHAREIGGARIMDDNILVLTVFPEGSATIHHDTLRWGNSIYTVYPLTFGWAEALKILLAGESVGLAGSNTIIYPKIESSCGPVPLSQLSPPIFTRVKKDQ